MRASKWAALTEGELQITAAALEHYVTLGPKTAPVIQLAVKMAREIREYIKALEF